MEMLDILNKWAEFSGYDPDQKLFSLNSLDMHLRNENLKHLQEYDPSGSVSLLYAKRVCGQLFSKTSVNLMKLLEQPEVIRDAKEMWEMFSSPEVKQCEETFRMGIEQTVSGVIQGKMLGKLDLDVLLDSISIVGEELHKCNVDLFMKGGTMAPLSNFFPKIQVFQSTTESLLAMEHAPDGIYFCFINYAGASDGYFSFFLKSNGTLLSINDRVDEAYPTQHAHSRNGRWMENKQLNLFPYRYIFKYSDRDYKCYAKKMQIDHSKLDFCNLEPEVYMPIILAMVLLNNKHQNTLPDIPLHFAQNLLPVNQAALMLKEQTALTLPYQSVDLSMTTEEVKDINFNKQFKETALHYSERGEFPNEDGVFVSLYGDGFVYCPETALKVPQIGEGEVPVEIIGSEARFRLLAYQAAREQLAEYIRDRMYEEYKAFGMADGVRAWWRQFCKDNQQKLVQICVTAYKEPDQRVKVDEGPYFRWYNDGKNSYIYAGGKKYFHCCLSPQKRATMSFEIEFDDWKELEEISPIPKIIKGWKRDGHRTYGNPLLRVTDPISSIGTPLEYDEIHRNERLGKITTGHGFQSWNGKQEVRLVANLYFSKQEFKKLLK